MTAPAPDELDRYHRQMLLPGFGAAGQRRIGAATVLLVGCGALGTVIADLLARAGVGRLRIVDRDVVELTNLQRQVLFDERDVERGAPKALAAREALARINRHVAVEAHVDDFGHRNAERLAAGADVLVDGLDNFETRYLLNDLAVHLWRPYVYGGAVGTTGMSMPVLPRRGPGAEAGLVAWSDDESTPCLRCVFPDAPPPGATPTCDTAGVLGSVVTMIAAHQVTQVLKLLTGHVDRIDRALVSLDVWSNETSRFDVAGARTPDCPCCGARRLEYLDGAAASATSALCGRNAVQIVPAATAHGAVDLAAALERLAPHGEFACTEHLLRGRLTAERTADGDPYEITLFPNGRAIIRGTSEPETARSLYARYVGS